MKELELQDCDVWISGLEACRVLGISTTTLKRYRTQGKLSKECFKKLNSRMVRYNLKGLKDLMESREFNSDDVVLRDKFFDLTKPLTAKQRRTIEAENKRQTKEMIQRRLAALKQKK
jgi:DNA-binding transcriptional MerR regulator